jgi:hypothetical protein
MAQIAPPPPPPVIALRDDDGARRLRFQLWQLLTTGLTVLLTAWICTLGILPAILALMIAKHVLVAILIVGLDQRKMPEAEA